MTKIYSSTPKDGLRTCVGPEVMKRKVLNCAAVLRPLEIPSTLWKYGRVLSHSAILCITKKEHVLIEYTSTNLVHVNLIGGFANKESEIGPYFEYRGFIFHYMSPIQQPKKDITVRDLSLKMASYMCKKPYDVFTNNCHQARYLTMKHYGMKSHDPYNIKYNILFQGVADYFTKYNDNRVKKNLGYDFTSEAFHSDLDSQHSNSANDFTKENESKSDSNKKNNNKKSSKSKSNNKCTKKVLSVRCSSTQDISKLGKDADTSKQHFFSRNIHLDHAYTNSVYIFKAPAKFSESSSNFLSKNKENSGNNKSAHHIEIVKKLNSIRRCKSDTHIPIIRNPYNQRQSKSDSCSSDNSPPPCTSESSSKNQKTHHSKNNNIFNKLKRKAKNDGGHAKKFKFLKVKMNGINFSASGNIPQLTNTNTNQTSAKQKKK